MPCPKCGSPRQSDAQVPGLAGNAGNAGYRRCEQCGYTGWQSTFDVGALAAAVLRYRRASEHLVATLDRLPSEQHERAAQRMDELTLEHDAVVVELARMRGTGRFT